MKKTSSSSQSLLRAYYVLTKPGIVRGNLFSAAAGFLLGGAHHLSWVSFIGMLAGTALIIACGCVLNNCLDRDIDKKMERTRNRPLVTGRISLRGALIYAAVLGCAGFALLLWLTNWQTALVGLIGLVFYVVVYGIGKRTTDWGTLIGSISGATPPVAGYTAATGQFDLTALLLFIVLAIWQMPHFYAIAIYRKGDYQAARIPLWSITRGLRSTRRQIVLYIVLFILTAPLLSLTSQLGWSYAALALAIGVAWLFYALKKQADMSRWAKGVFGYSLLVLLVLSGLWAIGPYLP